jgi:3-oxoacyl-[acyl-carrier-protein] synthase II
MLIGDIAAGYISMMWQFKGPNYSVQSACATASNSIGVAMMHLLLGDSDVVVCGGAEAPLTPTGVAGFNAAMALSTRNDDPLRASRPFDKDRDGFVMAEGGATFVLETEEHAKARGATILAELAGYGFSGDAYHLTAPAPHGEGAVRSMRAALKVAGVEPDQVDYLNAHGTSTAYNDSTETEAIKTVFGDYAYKMPISSTKSSTGHLLGAAGGVELAACVQSIRTGVVAPTINYETPDPACDLDYVPNEPRDVKVDVALSNTFGFGGHNATLVARRYQG